MTDYTSEQKNIFGPYDNGESMSFGDPYAIWRSLNFHTGGELIRIVEQHRATDGQGNLDLVNSYDATNKLITACVHAFHLKTVDHTTGKGIDEKRILELFDAFIEWLKKKETSTPRPPTPPRSMDPSFLAKLGLPMNSGLVSGLTSPAFVHNTSGK